MTNQSIYKIIRLIIALIWIVNGAFCKVFGFVPRHQEIVQRILSFDRPSAHFTTITIGFLEVLMAIWILSNIKSRINSITQIIIIALMNVIEFILAPDLLLWGSFNSVFAFIFILIIYYNEFHLKQKTNQN